MAASPHSGTDDDSCFNDNCDNDVDDDDNDDVSMVCSVNNNFFSFW